MYCSDGLPNRTLKLSRSGRRPAELPVPLEASPRNHPYGHERVARFRRAFSIFGRSVREPQAHLVVLLGGEAGLRLGQMIGLEWTDLNRASDEARAECEDAEARHRATLRE